MLIGLSSFTTPLVALLLVLRFPVGLALACLWWRLRRRPGFAVEFVTPGEEVVVVDEGLAGMGFLKPLVALVLALLISIVGATAEEPEVGADSVAGTVEAAAALRAEEATEAAEVSAEGCRGG